MNIYPISGHNDGIGTWWEGTWGGAWTGFEADWGMIGPLNQIQKLGVGANAERLEHV